MKLQDRINRIAKILCLTDPVCEYDVQKGVEGAWFLCGDRYGDTVLPQSRGAKTIEEALEFAEAWLSPEIFGATGHVSESYWRNKRDQEDPGAIHPCDNWRASDCMCKGACSCHWNQVLPVKKDE